jgi:hypothetical protein
MEQENKILEREKMGNMSSNLQLEANLVNGQVVITATGGGNGNGNIPQGDPPQRFTFNLDDNTGLSVQFLDPGWLCVNESGTCPPLGSGIVSDQITNVNCSNRTAQFTDQNSKACTLGYALYFSCSNGTNPSFDPIITNGGQTTNR